MHAIRKLALACVTAAALARPARVHATDQVRDAVRFEGNIQFMIECPLNKLLYRLPDRPEFGYEIQFTTGTTAEALLPAKRPALPDRPGFGYAINFLPGDPKDSLFPPGWTEQRGMTIVTRP